MKLAPSRSNSTSSSSASAESNEAELRQQRCQRCLNHGEIHIRKNHSCPFKNKFHTENCTKGCRLIDLRRLFNKHINDKAAETTPIDVEGDTPPPGHHSTKRGGRSPTCAACKIHGEINALRGHKRRCRFSKCKCDKCELVQLRRSVMAEQVKLRRKQQQNPYGQSSSIGMPGSVDEVQTVPGSFFGKDSQGLIRPEVLKPVPVLLPDSQVVPLPVVSQYQAPSVSEALNPFSTILFPVSRPPHSLALPTSIAPLTSLDLAQLEHFHHHHHHVPALAERSAFADFLRSQPHQDLTGLHTTPTSFPLGQHFGFYPCDLHYNPLGPTLSAHPSPTSNQIIDPIRAQLLSDIQRLGIGSRF